MNKSNASEKPDFLKRYTTLPILLDILLNKRITLLSPATWEDRNDSFYLEYFKAKKKHQTVLALCFSQKTDTFHHWKIFSSGASGVCIEFDKKRLLRCLKPKGQFYHGEVIYKSIAKIEKKQPELDDLPFLKRQPFKDESEYRILYCNHNTLERTKDVLITPRCINRVTLSPWIPEKVANSVGKILQRIEDWEHLKVVRTTLLENERWKKAISDGQKLVGS